MKGRQGPDGTRHLLNILSKIEHTKTPAIVLSLNAEKAFDRIYWGFVFKNVTKFGFRGNIISPISMLSKPFCINNGTRQGCLLSPVIFAMVMEPLTETIRTNPQIKGVKLANTQHKINVFADDDILILTDVDPSLTHTSEALNLFSKVSFYRVYSFKSLILNLSISPTTKNKSCKWNFSMYRMRDPFPTWESTQQRTCPSKLKLTSLHF